jgi:hypothetical protein
MTMHTVEYDYSIREGSSMTLDIDDSLSAMEKEAYALHEIKEMYDDITNIDIIRVEKVD